MSDNLRKTGLSIIGDVPWGTHFCQFYRSPQDLLDILVPYFVEGLQHNEFCMWVTSEPLKAEAARTAMAVALPGFEDFVNRGQIEIVPHTEWYLRGGTFDPERVLMDWVGKLDRALAAGYEGLRLTGNTFWLEPGDWQAFTDYEAAVDAVVGRYRMLAVCTYSLDRCGVGEILDVIRNHRFALVRREGRWELVESGERKAAEEQLRRLAQFPEQNPSPVLRVALGGDLMYANSPATALLSSLGPTENGRVPSALRVLVEKAARASDVVEAELTDNRGKTYWLAAVRPTGEPYVNVYARDITNRKRAEEASRQAKEDLEKRVQERTAELKQSNKSLEKEIQERLETERSLRLEEARLDALLRLSHMSDVPLPEMTGFTLEQAIALTRSKIGFLGFLNEDESVYTLHAVSKDVVKECNVTGDPIQWHVVDAGIWSEAIRHRRTLFVNDYSLPLPRKKGLPEGHPYIERFMVVPLLEEEHIVALAGVGNKASDYDASDERQVTLLLSGMWSCMQRNLAKDELERAYADLEVKVKERTASLFESQERLKRAQEIAHLGSWELDREQNRLTWSDEVYRIFGLRPAEFGATYEAFLATVHPDDRATVDAAYSGSVREARDTYEIEHRIIRRDNGEVRFIHEKCEHRKDASGRIVRSIGMVQDITERKKTEALRLALMEQDRLRLGAAVEQASDAVIMVDLTGTILYVNAAFEAINRKSRQEAIGQSYLDSIAGDPAAGPVRESLIEGRSWHGHLIRRIAGERPVELEVTISSATDPSGRVIGRLITEKDVTYENALQRQVRQSQKMEALGTLAGGITHDFNNILGAIIINAELALLDLEPTHPARAPLPTVLQAARRGKELVKQIITFSRQREWEKKPLEIAPVAKEAMKLLRSTLPRDITVHETIAPDSGVVLGDPSHIHQILVNLCQNAALAMSDGGGDLEVRIEAVDVDLAMVTRHPDLKPGPHVRLTVADSGCGMSPDVMERLFEPFFTTRGPGRGSGLGLAVVHGIVRSYDGAITVYSEPGKGSVFSIYLPRFASKMPEETSIGSPAPVGGRERILFVEDEEAQRTSLGRSLKRLGYAVTARASGRSALSAFRKDPGAFDVVVTDQTMPGMSGLELASALLKIRPDIPVILCTGFSEKVNGEAVAENGIREFVMKPFTLEEISRLIAKAAGRDIPSS